MKNNSRWVSSLPQVCRPDGCHQNGSIIVIVLMLLTIMSIIGIASTNTTVTENFIVRNAAIRKQNVQMVDAVVSEALQRAMDAGLLNNDQAGNDDPSDTDAQVTPGTATSLNWIIDTDIWENTVVSGGQTKQDQWYDPTYAGWVLTNDDEAVDPALDLDNVSDRMWEAPSTIRKNLNEGIVAAVLTDRGDWQVGDGEAASPIRYAMVGWNSAPGSSLKTTSGVTRRSAEILTEYLSEDYGVTRMTVGMERNF